MKLPSRQVDTETDGVLPGELHMFDLDCGSHSSGLGLCLSGNRDGARGRMSVVCDSALFPQGAAVEDGRLRHGDQLLTVNGQSLKGVTHSEAVELLRQTSGASFLIAKISQTTCVTWEKPIETSAKPLVLNQGVCRMTFIKLFK
uniref:PDZ domain-containing protein n=1 Tax=Sinocyclocheilus grahami TaxID=75366 RepID=A0A672MSB0_SINGR